MAFAFKGGGAHLSLREMDDKGTGMTSDKDEQETGSTRGQDIEGASPICMR